MQVPVARVPRGGEFKLRSICKFLIGDVTDVKIKGLTMDIIPSHRVTF
jgi:hypothetical protein